MSRRQKATPEEKIYLIKRYIKGEISQAQWSVLENNRVMAG